MGCQSKSRAGARRCHVHQCCCVPEPSHAPLSHHGLQQRSCACRARVRWWPLVMCHEDTGNPGSSRRMVTACVTLRPEGTGYTSRATWMIPFPSSDWMGTKAQRREKLPSGALQAACCAHSANVCPVLHETSRVNTAWGSFLNTTKKGS